MGAQHNGTFDILYKDVHPVKCVRTYIIARAVGFNKNFSTSNNTFEILSGTK